MTVNPGDPTLQATLKQQEALSSQVEAAQGPEAPRLFEIDGLRSYLLAENGRAADAVAVCESRLAKQGAHSLMTLPCLDFQDEFGRVLGLAGRTDDAVTVLATTQDRLSKVLGDDHPRTLEELETLASTLGRAGRAREAASLYGDLVERRTRTVGPDAPETVSALRGHARACSEAGLPGTATGSYRRLVDMSARRSGALSEETLNLREALVATLIATTDSTAQAQQEQLADDSATALGGQHPATLSRRMVVAELIGESGDTQRAAGVYRQLKNLAIAALGPDHDIARRCSSRETFWVYRQDPRWHSRPRP